MPSRAALLVCFAAAWGLAACISGVEIEGAPCPCPEGYQCCATLNDMCLAEEEACPHTHPPSSRRHCRTDADCLSNELCQSWTLAGGEPAGPGECRWSCGGDHPCAPGETCAPTLHDGRPLDTVHAALTCVAETPPGGCEGLDCRQCGPEQVGRSYCEENGVAGCFLALHPVCGLTCRELRFEDCGAVDCVETDKGARCAEGVFQVGPCDERDCAACGPPGKAGGVFCDGNEVVACTSLPAWDALCPGACECEEICLREVVAACDGACVETGGARCQP
jgi:hypothetical protein